MSDSMCRSACIGKALFHESYGKELASSETIVEKGLGVYSSCIEAVPIVAGSAVYLRMQCKRHGLSKHCHYIQADVCAIRVQVTRTEL